LTSVFIRPAPESPFVSEHSTRRILVTAVIIFIAAHLALMIGLTTPDKIIFDEVHSVPAARQMLEPADICGAAAGYSPITPASNLCCSRIIPPRVIPW
jgi:hypothetical protein